MRPRSITVSGEKNLLYGSMSSILEMMDWEQLTYSWASTVIPDQCWTVYNTNMLTQKLIMGSLGKGMLFTKLWAINRGYTTRRKGQKGYRTGSLVQSKHTEWFEANARRYSHAASPSVVRNIQPKNWNGQAWRSCTAHKSRVRRKVRSEVTWGWEARGC